MLAWKFQWVVLPMSDRHSLSDQIKHIRRELVSTRHRVELLHKAPWRKVRENNLWAGMKLDTLCRVGVNRTAALL